LKNLIRDRKVFSFYETEQTRRLVLVRVDICLNRLCHIDHRIGLGKRTIETHWGFCDDSGRRLGSSPAP
jgi:hypothetical protein